MHSEKDFSKTFNMTRVCFSVEKAESFRGTLEDAEKAFNIGRIDFETQGWVVRPGVSYFLYSEGALYVIYVVWANIPHTWEEQARHFSRVWNRVQFRSDLLPPIV